VSVEAEYTPVQEEGFKLDFRTLMVLFSVMLAVILEIIDGSIVNVALPHMMGNFGATVDEIGWVVTGYIISNVIVIPMTGWLSLRFGRKRYLVTSILLFTAASVLCGLSTSLVQLVTFRVLQGIGGGALLSTAQSVMIEIFPPSRQGVGQAIFGVGAMIGPSLGPTLGGWITSNASWRWIFYINIPFGFLAVLLCLLYMRDPPYLKGRRDLRVDFLGMLLLVVGIGSLQTLLERGHRLDWFESRFVVLLAIMAASALVLFVVRELTTRDPVVDLRVLRYPSLSIGCVLGFIMGVSLYGSTFLFPVFSQNLLGWTAWQSGLAILPSSIGTALTMAIVGRLVWKVGPRPIYFVGLGIFFLVMTEMMRWNHLSGWNDIIWPQLGRGVALGCMFVPVATATLRTLPLPDVPTGAGLYNLFRQLGGSMGIAMIATLLDQRTNVHRAYLSEHVSPLSAMTRLRLGSLQQMFMEKGFDPSAALHSGYQALSGLIDVQSNAMAFEDGYRFIIGTCMFAVPLAFFLGRGAPLSLRRS